MYPDDCETPGDLRDLRRPEHLLVWALRAIAVGHGDCPSLCRAFVSACGLEADRALLAYFVLVRNIGVAGRRRLRLHTPGCVRLSPDERAILAAVAAAQDALRTGQRERLKAHLRWLVEGEPDESLLFAAETVAGVLQDNGHRLPLRIASPIAPGPAAGPISLHPLAAE